MSDMDKYETGQIEDPERKEDLDIKTGNNVADTEARGYVDPNLIITEEENKTMRRKIHKRYSSFTISASCSRYRVLPLMCLVYIVQALDKGTLGPAS
jgi:hypothetical protein